ncbi:hypothetical protein OGAPHI_004760 [Ogataea philodendri]|uniref:Cytochrome c oxidase assembly protein COX11 n=1 Tax=Ogataea philodendri TaxID=1378263 RepID=A0A9P8P2W7_9ASCO|nr:uncharacterized protein OGAPHI_004760 [Ogataea philodendri]KAH3664046.1 hypothetical protein OGAPHI_004760 [Ogataea philodendri]
MFKLQRNGVRWLSRSARVLNEASKPKKELPRLSMEEYRTLREEYYNAKNKIRRQTATNYSVSLFLVFMTLSFASVPLYRVVCQKTGWGGTPMTDSSKFTPDKLVPVDTDKKIRVSFTAETSRKLPWKFVPQQREVYLVPGETALAFYKAKNVSSKDITGMATYSVTPDHIAPYFNKIQCFCFEEQRLNAGEEVDMPLFFFIDPEFSQDPSMRNVEDIVLHYTFFKATHDESHEQIMAEAQKKKEAEKSANN